MNRRGFLGALLGTAAGLALDPEKLLWVPGKKLISIPKPVVTTLGTYRIKIGDTILIRKPLRFLVKDPPLFLIHEWDAVTIRNEAELRQYLRGEFRSGA